MTSHFSHSLRRGAFVVMVAYWLALVMGTHWPHLPQIGPKGFDKVLHLSAYAGLITLVSVNIFWGRAAAWWQYGLVFLGLALFGGCDELTQPPFGRTADWLDWYADLTGLTIGLFVAVVLNWAVSRWLLTAPEGPRRQADGQ
jgi:VanZ family protein